MSRVSRRPRSQLPRYRDKGGSIGEDDSDEIKHRPFGATETFKGETSPWVTGDQTAVGDTGA